MPETEPVVIPAQAGILRRLSDSRCLRLLDSRFRGNDYARQVGGSLQISSIFSRHHGFVIEKRGLSLIAQAGICLFPGG